MVGACALTAAFAWGLGLFGASVFLKALSAHHGWSISLISGAITGFYLTSAASAWLVGAQIDRRGARPVLLAGTLALALGVSAIGQVSTVPMLYLAFVVLGLGWSCLSSTGLSAAVAPWFDRHQGRATTLALMGASAGSILGVPLLMAAIAHGGLSLALPLIGLLTLLVLVPIQAMVLRHRGPDALGQSRDGVRPEPAGVGSRPAIPASSTREQALRSPLFWQVAAAFALAMTMQIGFLTHQVSLATSVLGLTGAGLLVSGTGLTALAGRILLAKIADRVAVRPLAGAMMGLATISLTAMAIWPSPAALIASSLSFGFTVGMLTTLSPVIVRRHFGPAAYGAIYGTAATLIQFSSACGPALYGLLRDAFDSYRPGLALAAAVDALAALVLLAGARGGSRAAGTTSASVPRATD